MTGDREFRELAELARTAERLARPLPPAQVRRVATVRRRRAVLSAAATAAVLALGSGVALSEAGPIFGRASDPAVSPPGVPSPTPRPRAANPDESSASHRELTGANLLKAADVPRYGSSSVAVAAKGAGRSAARISLCFPDRGVAKLDAQDSRSRNFASRGGASGGPGGEQTTSPTDESTVPPVEESTSPGPSATPEPTVLPGGPTSPPPDPTGEPTSPPPDPTGEPTNEPTDESTTPPDEEPTPEPVEEPTSPDGPAATPDPPGPSAGDPTSPPDGPTTDPDGEQSSSPPDGPEPSEAPAKPTVYTTALQFVDAAAAETAYERILDWRKDCEDTLSERGYVLLDSGWRVPVEVDGDRGGEFVEVTYRKAGDSPGARIFESTGVARVADRLMLTVTVVSGEDYQVSLDPEGDPQTGQPAHPQFALVSAAAERLAR